MRTRQSDHVAAAKNLFPSLSGGAGAEEVAADAVHGAPLRRHRLLPRQAPTPGVVYLDLQQLRRLGE